MVVLRWIEANPWVDDGIGDVREEIDDEDSDEITDQPDQTVDELDGKDENFIDQELDDQTVADIDENDHTNVVDATDHEIDKQLNDQNADFMDYKEGGHRLTHQENQLNQSIKNQSAQNATGLIVDEPYHNSTISDIFIDILQYQAQA